MIKIRFSSVVINFGNKKVVLVSKPKKKKDKKKNTMVNGSSTKLRAVS